MLEVIGWIGSICFAICGAPQAYRSYKDGHSESIEFNFMLLWLIGEVATMIYVLPKSHWPLIFNYAGNLVFISIILWYKFFPRGSDAGSSN